MGNMEGPTGERGNVIKYLIRLVGCLYGIVAIFSIPATFLSILALFSDYLGEPNNSTLGNDSMSGLIATGPRIVNFIILCLLCYSFLTFRKWGRYLAVVYNSVFTVFFLLVASDSMRMSTFREINLQFSLALVGAFGALLVFSLLKPVRDIMQ
jgi:hypothetical protein